MIKLFVFLQSIATNLESSQPVANNENYLDLLVKGGWVMLPIALLSILAIYYIIERWLVISKLSKRDSIWQSRVFELVSEGKIDKALNFCFEKPYVLGKVTAAGLKDIDEPIAEIEKSMEVEGRQQLSKLESHMGYLGVIASIAPMLGFLGTIFGVIKIFYNISQTADLDIATISDGLYQKMICSGAGLLVGIIAYAGYYILNSRIDKVIVDLDKDSNEVVRAIKDYKKKESIQVSNNDFIDKI